ncbi:MAG: zinc ribbon domain-containing protein, partial [Muribaculaceae bacterium]|nr:zinc ribbon domain-containing protein [Muribaculaceae bacterium]
MRCPECGGEISENEVFCPSCGSELFGTSEKPAEPDVFEVLEETEKGNSKKKKKSKNKDKNSAKRQKLIVALRVTLIVLLAALITVLIFVAADSVSAARGRKIFDKVPLGRSIDMIKSESGADFSEGKVSAYGAVNHISDYN